MQCKMRGFAVGPLLLVSLGAAGMDTRGEQPIRLSDAKATIVAEADRVKSIRLSETIHIYNKERPGWTQRFRQRNAEAMAAKRDAMLVALGDEPPEGSVAAIEREYEQGMTQVADLEAVARINRDLRIDRTRTVDFAGQRKCLDDTDQRPVDDLMEAEGIPHSLRSSVSRSETLVLEATRSVRMPDAIPDLAVVAPVPTFDAKSEYLSLGIVPDWVFSEDFELAIGSSETGCEIRAVDKHTGAIVLTFALSPGRSYRLVTWTTHSSDGAILEDREFSDYRKVGGTWIPFLTRTSRTIDGVRDAATQISRVREAEINPVLTDDTFAIPDGFRVQDLTGAWYPPE